MLLPYHQPAPKYTGELFSVQYLHQQSLPQLSLKVDEGDENEDEDEDDVDEGLGDEGLIFPPLSTSEDLDTFNPSVESPSSIIENLHLTAPNPSMEDDHLVEDDGCDEVYLVNMYCMLKTFQLCTIGFLRES